MNGRLPLPKRLQELDHTKPSLDDAHSLPGEDLIRLYPHLRGQWTVFIYVEVDIEPLEDLLDAIRAQNYLQPLLPVHVSLLRGHFAIRHHHIAPFVRLLQQSLALLRPVSLCLSQLEVFSNENQTKHFLCLCSPFRLKEHPIRELRDLIITARQSLFTIDPSCEVVVSSAPPIIDDFILHASLAVTKRSSLSELHKFIDLTQEIIEPVTIKVQQIQLKIGNQLHQIRLGN